MQVFLQNFIKMLVYLYFCARLNEFRRKTHFFLRMSKKSSTLAAKKIFLEYETYISTNYVRSHGGLCNGHGYCDRQRQVYDH